MTENSSGGLQSFFNQLADAFVRAQRYVAIEDNWLNIDGCSIRLRWASPALFSVLWPALAHLDAAPVDSPAITFHSWDSATTGVNPPRPPFTSEDYVRYGQRGLTDDGVIAVMYAPTIPMLFAFNRISREGFFWTADALSLSIYERAAPLQTLFYWALRQNEWHIIHAAAVGTAQNGVLLVGNTGAGKSTTSLATLQQDRLKFLCDDKCLVRLEPEPQAFAIFNSAKLKVDMLPGLPHLQPHITTWDESFKAGKGLLYIHPVFADKMVNSFPLKGLLIPRIGKQGQPGFTPAGPVDAFRVLGPSTVIWMPGAEADSYRFMAQLVRRLPCYFFDLSPQIDHNVELMAGFLQGKYE